MRTQLVRACGGWGGVPVDDDIVMFSGLSEIADGYNDPATTWLYRIHERQTHKSAQWRERSSDGRRVAMQRVEALRATGLAITGDPASAQASHDIEVGPAAKEGTDGRPWWKDQA